MNINPVERRRAEEFARLLDHGPAHPHSRDSAHASGASTESDELIGVTEKLGELGTQLMAASEPSQDWREATRRRLMAVAADEGVGATARHRASAAVPEPKRPPVLDELFPRRPRGGRRLAIVAALLTGTVAISGVSAASGDALPGETLYNVKRSTERAQLALAGNDLGRAQLHLEFARTRIAEAAEVTGEEDAAADALNDAAGELREGVVLLGELAVANDDPSPLDHIDLFTNEHRWVLEDLTGRFDGEAGTAADELAALVDEAAVRSVELRESLSCTEAGGEADALGPLPGACGHDSVDTTGPEQGPADASAEATSPDAGEATPEPSGETGSDPAQASNSPAADPVSDPPTDPASDGDSGSGEGEVLDELNGLVSDLFE